MAKRSFARPRAKDFHDNPKHRGKPDNRQINPREFWEVDYGKKVGAIEVKKRKLKSGEVVGVIHPVEGQTEVEHGRIVYQ